MKTGRAENKMKKDKEYTLATTREIIYLRKPGLEGRPGPLRPLLNHGHLHQRHRHLHPRHYYPLFAGVRGLARDLTWGDNCETAATFCCDSGHTRGREDDPAVDTILLQPMGEQK